MKLHQLPFCCSAVNYFLFDWISYILKDRKRESREIETIFDNSNDTGIVAKMTLEGQTDHLFPLESLLLLLMIICARKIYSHVFEVRLIQNIHDINITYDFSLLIYTDDFCNTGSYYCNTEFDLW